MAATSSTLPRGRGRATTRRVFALGALGALLFGYDNGIVGGAILFIPDDLTLNSTTKGFVVSSAVVGAMIGALICGPVSDRWGRQRLLLGAGAVFLVGAAGSALAPTVALLVAFRFVIGIGIGIASVAVPLYLAEMAPARLRGVATSLNQYLIVIGTGAAGGIGWALSFSASWRWMLAIGVIPALVLLGGLLFVPDTPRSLVRRGRREEARALLAHLREDPAEAEREFAEITEVKEESDPRSSAVQLGLPWVKRLLGLGIAMAIFQQIIGINAVVYYSPTVLTQIGFSQSGSLFFSFANGMLNILTIAVVVRLRIVDRAGRRPVLLAGTLLCAASLILIGVGNLATTTGSTADGVVTIAGFVIFTNTFSATWGPVLWVVLAEIFPLQVRGTAMAIATLFNWLTDFFVSQTYPTFSGWIGNGAMLLIYGAVGLVVFPVVMRILPETKSRSLEQLERDFETGTTGASAAVTPRRPSVGPPPGD